MTNKKISQLEEKTILEENDEFPFIRNENGDYFNYKVKKSNLNTTLPNSTSTVLGVIRLAGDLSGTSLNPTVPALITKANLISPNFTGTPTSPTPANGDNSNKLATTAFVNNAISNIASIGDATSINKGVIRLTGDLGGTANLPTVPQLALKVNSSDLSTVAISGDYNDLLNLPTLSTVAISGDYNNLLNSPTLISHFINDSGYITSNLVQSVAGKTGVVTLTKTDINLNNVDNTSDIDKPVSNAVKEYVDLTLRTIINNDSQLLTDKIIFINSTTNITFNLLSAANWINKLITIKNISLNIITIAANEVETIDNNNTISLNQYDSVTLFSNGTNIYII